MNHYIIMKMRSLSHNIYYVSEQYYHYMLCLLRRQGSLFTLFVLAGETILIFLTIAMILIIGLGADRW